MSRSSRRTGVGLPRVVVALAVAAVVLSGCGDDAPASGVWSEHAYVGPLEIDRAAALHPRAGAAGNVVDCITWGEGGSASTDGAGEYTEGATADSPLGALRTARSEQTFSGAQQGLLVAAQTEDRVLYVLEVGGLIKQAVIVHDGPAAEGTGGAGWYVESWARCDYAELPADVADAIGLQLWTDVSGRPAPASRIASWVGPAHCDWQSMTFLEYGDTSYVRAVPDDLTRDVVGPYDDHVSVPAGAVATGFHRRGDRLWIAADGRYAYVGARTDAEAWPRNVRLGCD